MEVTRYCCEARQGNYFLGVFYLDLFDFWFEFFSWRQFQLPSVVFHCHLRLTWNLFVFSPPLKNQSSQIAVSYVFLRQNSTYSSVASLPSCCNPVLGESTFLFSPTSPTHSYQVFDVLDWLRPSQGSPRIGLGNAGIVEGWSIVICSRPPWSHKPLLHIVAVALCSVSPMRHCTYGFLGTRRPCFTAEKLHTIRGNNFGPPHSLITPIPMRCGVFPLTQGQCLLGLSPSLRGSRPSPWVTSFPVELWRWSDRKPQLLELYAVVAVRMTEWRWPAWKWPLCGCVCVSVCV